jgi:uncharacterized membrane protein HdeD (DUF308 family)
MKKMTNKNWWFPAINGIIAILFGLLLLFFSRDDITSLMKWFGVLILVSGVIILLIAVYNIRKDKKSGMLLFVSVTSIALGLIITFFPGETLAFTMILVGIWAIIVGIVKLVMLMTIKAPLASKNILIISALLTIILGVVLFFNPISFAVVVVKLIGVIAVFLGVFLLYFSYVLSTLKQPEDPVAPGETK